MPLPPVNLANVNVSLAQFQAVSSGKYNAGEVRLAGENALEQINNHVHSTGKNRVEVSHKEVLARYGIPGHLTFDRAAALIGTRYLFKGKPCTLMDFGTTLTVDFLGAEGEYKGGNISLGCRTRFKALARYSKALPSVNIPETVPETGMSTVSSIEAGVISGIMFEIRGYIDSNPDNIIVFTGGDANYFAKRMKNSIFVVCNLVLIGLALITDDYVERKSK